jgi:pimeloyl-ACP methyl ester carboxylesterase
MTVLDTNGTTLEYVEQGSGEPIVFVHGSASDYRTWTSQLDHFGSQYRAIAYSRRYHWPNEPIREGVDYSMEEHVDDLQAFLRSLGAPAAHLVGHSYGAFVCLLLAIRNPELVRTLVLAEPPVITLFVSNSPKPSEILRLSFSRPRTAAAILKFGATGVGPASTAARRSDMEAAMRIVGNAVMGREFYERLSSSRLEQVRANAIKAELLGSGFARLDEESLRRIQTPTLLVSGQLSPRLFHRLIDGLEEFLPRTKRIEIAGASHIMHEDNAPAYNAAVLSFLAGRQAA